VGGGHDFSWIRRVAGGKPRRQPAHLEGYKARYLGIVLGVLAVWATVVLVDGTPVGIDRQLGAKDRSQNKSFGWWNW
jgi:hypothetical protein